VKKRAGFGFEIIFFFNVTEVDLSPLFIRHDECRHPRRSATVPDQRKKTSLSAVPRRGPEAELHHESENFHCFEMKKTLNRDPIQMDNP
jgi:hypothetical protein